VVAETVTAPAGIIDGRCSSCSMNRAMVAASLRVMSMSSQPLSNCFCDHDADAAIGQRADRGFAEDPQPKLRPARVISQPEVFESKFRPHSTVSIEAQVVR
jgi:hypothetical protein